MADKVLTQKTALGQTFLNAMWIAGFLAFVQLAAVGYAVYQRSIASSEVSSSPEVPIRSVAPIAEVEVKAAPPEVTEILPEPEQPPVEVEEVMVNSPDLEFLRRPAPDLSEIKDTVADIEAFLPRELVKSGRFYRVRKDYELALQNFKDAGDALPDHPLVLSEIAGTLGEMGELQEASKYWTKVTSLGPLIGGEFYNVASKMLKGQNPMAPKFEGGQVLKLGKVREQRFEPTAEGLKVVIRIPVFGNPLMNSIDLKKMNWNATFYDLINNQHVGTSIAEVKDSYPTGPYDWENELEEFEVTYFLPSSGQGLQDGRSYAGYGIKIFYDNELQDSVASSEEISELMFTRYSPAPLTPMPNIDNSLFPESGNR